MSPRQIKNVTIRCNLFEPQSEQSSQFYQRIFALTERIEWRSFPSKNHIYNKHTQCMLIWCIRGLGVLGKILKLVTFFSNTHSLIFFCWLFWLKRNEWWKRARNTFKLNFYSKVYNYFVERKVFSWLSKIFFLSVEMSIRIWEGISFFSFGTRKPIFSSMHRFFFIF